MRREFKYALYFLYLFATLNFDFLLSNRLTIFANLQEDMNLIWHNTDHLSLSAMRVD